MATIHSANQQLLLWLAPQAWQQVQRWQGSTSSRSSSRLWGQWVLMMPRSGLWMTGACWVTCSSGTEHS
jgi:hypothetical protein